MPESAAPTTEALDARVLLSFLARVKAGDFTARMPLDWTGVAGKVADALNDVVIADEGLEAELARVSRVVGQQGELSKRVSLAHSSHSWSGGVESVNSLIESLVRPASEMQRVIGGGRRRPEQEGHEELGIVASLPKPIHRPALRACLRSRWSSPPSPESPST